jgi:hypothetical protein
MNFLRGQNSISGAYCGRATSMKISLNITRYYFYSNVLYSEILLAHKRNEPAAAIDQFQLS